mmetsp:Transcript_38264/g.126263  ORF Transcript_38264/g.126263 Transcript_38264/m.126263 type:complete len:337 (+) Transcript_38264:168-1178(+)
MTLVPCAYFARSQQSPRLVGLEAAAVLRLRNPRVALVALFSLLQSPLLLRRLELRVGALLVRRRPGGRAPAASPRCAKPRVRGGGVGGEGRLPRAAAQHEAVDHRVGIARRPRLVDGRLVPPLHVKEAVVAEPGAGLADHAHGHAVRLTVRKPEVASLHGLRADLAPAAEKVVASLARVGEGVAPAGVRLVEAAVDDGFGKGVALCAPVPCKRDATHAQTVHANDHQRRAVGKGGAHLDAGHVTPANRLIDEQVSVPHGMARRVVRAIDLLAKRRQLLLGRPGGHFLCMQLLVRAQARADHLSLSGGGRKQPRRGRCPSPAPSPVAAARLSPRRRR